jgi:hypothetical protein
MSVLLWLISGIASAAEPIALRCGFAVGDEVRMLVTTATRPGSIPAAITNRATARIRVTEANADGWVFSWTFGPTTFDPAPAGVSADLLEQVQLLERIDDQATLLVRTDRKAVPFALANLDEVRAARARGVAAFEASLAERNIRGPKTDAMIADARGVSATDQRLSEYWLGQLIHLHRTLCTKYAEGPPTTGSATTTDGYPVTIRTSASVVERVAKIEESREMKTPQTGAMTDRLTVELTSGQAWPTLVRSETRLEIPPTHQILTLQRIE